MAETFAVKIAREQAKLKRQALSATAAPRLQNASLDDTDLPVFDRSGELKGSYGKQADGSYGGLVRNSPAQPTPSAPHLLAGEAGSVEATWDGATTDFAKPLVHGHTEVLSAFSEDGEEPDESVYHVASTIRDRDGGATTLTCPTPGTWFVRLRMVGQDRSTKGALSVASTVQIVALVETDGIRAALDDAEARLADAREDFEAGNQARKDEIDQLNHQRIPALESALDAVSGTVDDYDGQINQAQSAANQARGTAETLRDATVPALAGRLDNNETALGEAEARIDGVRDVAEDLRDTRLPALESSLSDGLVDANEWRVDGWIEARHIVAESIAGAVGEFLQISATQIDTEGLAAYLADIIELNASQITSGTISTDRLDAETVAAAVGNFLTLDALEINFEQLAGEIASIIQITSESIVSAAIQTRHLAIGDFQNYLPVDALSDFRTSGLESPLWSGVSQNANGWRTTDTQGGMPVALRWDGPVLDNTGDSRLGYRLGGKGMNVRPGEQIRLTGYGWRGTGQSGNVGVRFVFRDDNGTLVAWGPSGAGHVFQSGWRVFEMKATVPENDTIRYATIDFYAQPNSNQGHWGNFKWSRMVQGELLVDGAVKSRSLDTEQVFSDQAVISKIWSDIVRARMLTADEAFIGGALIQDGTIDVDKLNVTSELTAAVGQFLIVQSDQIAANALDAMVITAPTLQSHAAQSQGWKLRPGTGLEMWEPNGTKTVQINGDQNFIQGSLATAEGAMGRVHLRRYATTEVYAGNPTPGFLAGMGFESDSIPRVAGAFVQESDGRVVLSSGTGGDSTLGRPYGLLAGGWETQWLRPRDRLETFDSCIVGRPVSPALVNNFRGAPSGEQEPSYTRLGDWVMLSGAIRKPLPEPSNWSGTIMFVPAPGFTRRISTTIASEAGLNEPVPLIILIDTSGRLSVLNGVGLSRNWSLSLDGLIYKL